MFGPEYYTPGGYLTDDGSVLCVSCGQADEAFGRAFGREDSGLTPVTEADLQSWGGQCACDGGGVRCDNYGYPSADNCAEVLVEPAPCECDEGHELTRYGLSCGDTCPECSEKRADELEIAAEEARAVLVSLADRLDRLSIGERTARELTELAELALGAARDLSAVSNLPPRDPDDLPPFLSFPSRPLPRCSECRQPQGGRHEGGCGKRVLGAPLVVAEDCTSDD